MRGNESSAIGVKDIRRQQGANMTRCGSGIL